MSRKSFVGGNWKSFNNPTKVAELVAALKATDFSKSVDVLVAPTFLYIDRVKQALGDSFIVAAQNASLTDDGAFTGEVSASGLKAFGLDWVILGHSERRALFGEVNATVGSKTTIALKNGLSVVACVGETLKDREDGNTNAVVAAQLAAIKAGVDAVSADAWAHVVIAYEPVWAIGTGVVATPAQAQDTQKFIRGWLADNCGATVAAATRIIYGGSVKANNAAELFSQPDIDGFLVGGASLVAKEFQQIVAAAAQSASL